MRDRNGNRKRNRRGRNRRKGKGRNQLVMHKQPIIPVIRVPPSITANLIIIIAKAEVFVNEHHPFLERQILNSWVTHALQEKSYRFSSRRYHITQSNQ